MDARRRKAVIIAFFSTLMVSRIFMILSAVVRQRKLSPNRSEHVSRKRKRENDECEAVTAAAALQLSHGCVRFWMDARSNHWITRVLDGTLLQGEEFERTFRMNRNSFHILHGILSTNLLLLHLFINIQSLTSLSKTRIGERLCLLEHDL